MTVEVARLAVAFQSEGEQKVLRAIGQVDRGMERMADQSVRTAGRIGSSFSTAAGVVGGLFAAEAIKGVFGVGKGLLFGAAGAEQLRMQLETVTGSAEKAGAIFADLQTFAKETPFEFPELVQASSQLESFGLKTEDWINTIGDTASATGKSVNQVTQAVLDVQGNQFERLKELGIMASVEGDKLHLSYMENGKQIVETVDKNNKEIVNSTLQSIWNRRYEGAMKKQSKTFNGQLSTLKDNWNMTLQRMTGGFFDFSKGVLTEGNQFFDLFNRKLDQGLDPWHAAMSALHVTMDQVFGKGIGDTIDATLRGITDGVVGVTRAVSGLVGALASGDVSGFFSQLGGIAGSLVDWTLDVAAPTVTGWVVDVAGDVWGGLKDAAGWVWDNKGEIGTVALNIAGWTFDTAVELGAALALKISGLWSAIKDDLRKLGTIALTIPGWAFETAIELGAALGVKVSGLWGQVKDEVYSIGPIVLNVRSWTMGELDQVTKDDVIAAVKAAWAFDPIEITPEIEVNIHDAFENWTTSLINNPPDLKDVGKVAAAAIAPLLFPLAVPGLVAAWVTKNVVPDLARGIGAALSGVWDAVALNTDIGGKIDAFLFGGSQVEISPGGAPFVVDGQGFVDRITEPFRNIDLSLTDIVNPFLEIATTVEAWIETFQAAIDRIPEPSIPDFVLDPWGWIESKIRGAKEENKGGQPGRGFGFAGSPFGLASFLPGGANFGTGGGVAAELTFTATFDADTQGVQDGSNLVWSIGNQWKAETFTSFFDADTRGAQDASNLAWSIGNQWAAETFSARFSVDTSGLFAAVDVARSVAQQIRDLMPSSPARKGPLSTPISFDYIADSFAASMARVQGYATAGMGAVAGMRPSYGSLGGASFARSRPSAPRGGDTYLVDLSNAVVGRGAMDEIKRMIAEGSIRTFDGRSAANRLAGR